MKRMRVKLMIGAAALCATFAAHAQEVSNSVIGPPQLRDFQIQPKQRIVTQPATPQPQAPVPAPAPPPAAATPSQAPVRETRRAEPAQRPAGPTAAPAPSAAAPQPAPTTEFALPPAEPVAPSAALPPGQPAPAPAPSGTPLWYYAAPAALLALLGFIVVRRRRRALTEPVVETLPAVAAPPPVPVKPRADPVPRPWLELALKAERASFTMNEAELLFELEIANQGGSVARNLRIDVKMFNGGAEQDKQIGAFFKTAGREATKLKLPEVAVGMTGVIQGRVTLAREEMKAMRLDERLLFVPVVAVNCLYDWGQGRTGQTSKSYVVGREAQEPGDKMGAFRVDQGPRVWRTVGQRPHSLAKRV
jgi:MYXO-CTERM domain-containing protein